MTSSDESKPSDDSVNRRRPFQFGLRRLLVAVIGVGLLLRLGITLGFYGAIIFVALVGVCFIVIALRRNERWRLNLGLGLLAPLVLMFLSSGEATGVEFSPDLFAHRSFRYRASVFSPNVSLTPRQTRQWHSDLEEYLHEKGLVPPSKVKIPRWHLVKGFAPGVRGWNGEARTMCYCLGCWSGDSKRWVAWSEKHPELAKVLWPAVVQWARQSRYDEISQLIAHVKSGGLIDTAQLRKQIQFLEVNGPQ